jgi:DNA replication regulator SLD3
MPSVPGLKREASEAPSLSGIPFAESQPLAANRGGVLNSKRFSRREVDLGSFASDLNAKAKKKVSIEAELKDAISALKKPNRELAGKVLVETAEKRSASATHSRSKFRRYVKKANLTYCRIQETCSEPAFPGSTDLSDTEGQSIG